MKSLYDTISRAIARDDVAFSVHADERLRQRGIVRWQVIEGFRDGELISGHPDAQPNPKIAVRQVLADGSEVIAIWGFVASIRCAKLITVFFKEAR
jgi:hypothetical protein